MAFTAKSATKKVPAAKTAPVAKTTPVAKKAVTSDPTTAALAKELAALQVEVKSLRAELADAKASTSRNSVTPATVQLAGDSERINKIISLLQNSSLIRDHELSSAGLT